MGRTDPEEESWAAFDAALRSVERAGPDASLRERCLPRRARPSIRRVLVVDDEPNIRRLVGFHLEQAGYEVLAAVNGREALERTRADRPDLIVLDVMMPELDGFQVLDALKGAPETVEIPVLMLTARSSDDDIRHGWHGGNDFYLTKPFNPRELLLVVERIAEVLGTPENPPPLRRWLK